ncbi:MAG: hypothetical protein E7Z62_03575 [Thermoplasmata archaeon]|nr:hypothetical protein [Thermoplasmata archaeon]
MNCEMRMLMFAALAILMASACVMIHDSDDSDAYDLVEDDLTINVGQTKTFYWVDDLHEDWWDLIQAAGGNYTCGLATSTTWGSWVNYSQYDLEPSVHGLELTAKSTLSPGKYYMRLVIMDEGGVDELEDLLYGVTVKAASTTNYTVTFSISSGSSYGSLNKTSIFVPSGTTYSKSGNSLVFKSGSTTLYTITPTPKTATSSYTYEFGSWSSTSGTITANKTITCTFTRTAATTLYTCYLYYDANGGSGAPSTQSYTGSSTSSHSFTISSTAPTRSGYTFLGWSTSSSASTASYSGGSSISVTYNGSKTLYAVWQKQVTSYSITVYKGNWDSFKWVGGSDTSKYTSSSHTYTVVSGESFDIDWYGKSSESGSGTDYTYTTTYTSSNYNMATSLYGTSLGDSVTITGSKSYYPATQMTSTTTYTYSFTISYNANGGSGAPSSTTATSTSTSKSITLSSTTPTRSGYTFLGWSTSSSASSASYSAGSSYTFSYGTTALYAVWQTNTITVTGTPDSYGIVGTTWAFKPTVSVSGCSVTISGASWLTANGTNVSGTPSTAGDYTITLTFSKSGYTSATKTFTVTVLSALTFDSNPTGGAIIYAV